MENLNGYKVKNGTLMKDNASKADLRNDWELVIPDGVEKISQMVFWGNKRLERVVIPGSIKELKTGYFEYCTNLREVKLEEGIQKISFLAFKNCPNLQIINIPASVTEINLNAFGTEIWNLDIETVPGSYGEKFVDEMLKTKSDNERTITKPEAVILGIEGILRGKFEESKEHLFSGEQYVGIEIRISEGTYLERTFRVEIEDERECCEIWGTMLSEDDLTPYIGSVLHRIDVCNTNLKSSTYHDFCEQKEQIDYIQQIKNRHGICYRNIQFINFYTSKGMFQLTVYNCHNGYYGHDVTIKYENDVLYKKKI